jgi:hypothetical protein
VTHTIPAVNVYDISGLPHEALKIIVHNPIILRGEGTMLKAGMSLVRFHMTLDFQFVCVFFILCVPIIVFCVLYCLCSFLCCVLFERGVLVCVICVLCLLLVPLSPGKTQFVTQLSNNNNNNNNNPSSRSMFLGSTQPQTKMITRNFPAGKEQAVSA